MKKIIVAGIGTEVGKTVASAILAIRLSANYWKPIQCGPKEEGDFEKMQELLNPKNHTIFPPSYSFKAPLSPHSAAAMEGIEIDLDAIQIPHSTQTLIIEAVGGIMVPLTEKRLSLDLFQKWDAEWVVVSKHYLGSINHTLLTLSHLKEAGIRVRGIIFNGIPHPESERVIHHKSGYPLLARILPQPSIHSTILQELASVWNPLLF